MINLSFPLPAISPSLSWSICLFLYMLYVWIKQSTCSSETFKHHHQIRHTVQPTHKTKQKLHAPQTIYGSTNHCTSYIFCNIKWSIPINTLLVREHVDSQTAQNPLPTLLSFDSETIENILFTISQAPPTSLIWPSVNAPSVKKLTYLSGQITG